MEEPVSGPSDEQIPEEGGAPEEEEIADVIPSGEEAAETPSEEAVDEPVAEEPTEDEMTLDGAQINADETETLTVTITGWKDSGTVESPIPGRNKMVTVTASASEGDAAFDDAEGTIKIQKDKTLTLNVTAKAGYQLNNVKIGGVDNPGQSGSNYSTKITANTNVTIDVSELKYTLLFTAVEADVKIKLDDTVKDDSDKAEIATGETANIKRGAEPKDLAFTITGLDETGLGAGKKLHVSVKADGSAVADEIDVMETKGTDNKVTYSCKIDKADIAALKTGLEVIVKVEPATAVTAPAEKGNNSMVVVKFWADKDTSTSTATPGWQAPDATVAGLAVINKALAGETFRFQVKMNEANAATYTIDKVEAVYNTDKKATVEAKTDGEYNFVMPAGVGVGGVEIVVTTKVDDSDSKTRALSFTITGGDDTATATITKIVTEIPAVTGENSSPAVTKTYTEDGTATTTADALANFPGLKDSRAIAVDKGIKLPKANGKEVVKSIEVQVTATDGYTLTKVGNTAITSENLPTASLLTFADADTTLIDTIAVTAETEVTAVASSTAKFTVAKQADYTEATTPFIGDITVGGDAEVETAAAGETPAVYKLKANAKVVTLTLKTKEGYKLTKEKITNTKSVTGLVKSVSAAAGNGEVTWTVELFASKIAGHTTDALDITVDAAQKMVKVQLAPVTGGNEDAVHAGYSISDRKYTPMGAAEGTTPTPVADGNAAIAYGAKYEMTITPSTGVRLSKVSYKMGETETPVELEPEVIDDDDTGRDIAKIVIAKVTDDVVITVETEKDYELTALKSVIEAGGVVSSLGNVDQGAYGIYSVSPSGEYAVGLKQGGAAVDLVAEKVTAVVKNASGTVVTMPRVVFTYDKKTYLKINLAGKKLGGQEITIDMMKDGAVVGTYRLQVAKEATYVRLAEGSKIRQTVDSVQTYTVETDGELSDISFTAVGAGTGSFQANVIPAYDNKGNLTITLKPMASSDVVTPAATEDGEATYKNVTFKLTVANSTVHQDITLEAEPLFDPTKKPTVTPVTSGASDVSFYVDVDLESANPKSGKLYYEVTATAKAKDGDGSDAKTFEAVAGSKLKQEVSASAQSTGGKRRIRINVAKDGVDLGNGAAWAYDVKAKLVYNYNGGEIDHSVDSDTVAASTVDTYFASAMKLVKDSKKKPVTSFYTGQSFDTPQYIATPTFTDKKVNYKITDEILVDGVSADYQSRMNVRIDDNGDLVVDSVASGKSNVGKHTITVIATADMTGQSEEEGSGLQHTMYATRASITVNVVRGIESIAFQNFGSKLYKASGKAATLNVASSNIYFNGDTTGKNQPPKSKKVTYQVVGADSTSNDLKPAPAGITMKGTKVTVDKNFAIDPVKTRNNEFKIYVKAADYAGNTAANLSDKITVTGEAISLDNLVLAKAQYNDADTVVGYKVLAVQADKKTRNAVSAQEADGARIYVLGKPAAVGTTYSPAKWGRLAPEAAGDFTYKGGKKNVCEVDSDGYLDIYAGGVKADVTVTAKDGKKASAKLLLDIDWTATDGKDLALKIMTTESTRDINSYYTDFDISVYTPNKVQPDKDIESTATGTPRYYVEVMQGDKNDGTSKSFLNSAKWFVNCDLKVKGGKFVKKGTGYAYITATAEKTVITLTDKNVAKGQKAKVYNYTIVNKGFDKTLAKTSVKVTSKPNNLYNRAKTSEQTLDLSLMNGKDPVAKGKIAKIEVDWSARTDKNYYMYADFNDMIDSGAGSGKEAFFTVDEGGKTTLTFMSNSWDDNLDYYDHTCLGVGSYKLKVTVGTLSGTTFKPESQAANLSVKVIANKKFTFKPTTSYTFNPVDGAIALTGKASVGKGEMVGVYFHDLQNANLDGKSNKFTRLFKIDTDEKTGMQYLKLNTNSVEILKLMYDVKEASAGKADAELTLADFDTSKAPRVPDLTKIDKKHLTGYISYYAKADKGWYNTTASGTVKITIKIANLPVSGKPAKASQKYTPAETQIKSGKKDETTPINIYVSGVYVNIGLAMVDPGKKDEGSLIVEGDGVNADGQVLVKAASALENGKKYNANLLVVPKNSIYYNTVKSATDTAAKVNADGTTTETTTPAASRTDLMKLYGIPVKVTVVGAEKPVYAEAPKLGGGSGSGSETEKTVEEAVAAIEAITTWETYVTKNASGDGIADDAKTTAWTALEREIKSKLTGFTGFDYTMKSMDLKAGDLSKAEVHVAVSKEGQTPRDVTITIGAVAATAEKTATQVASDIQTAVQAKVTDSTIPAITWDGDQSEEARITNAAAIKTAIDAAVTDSGKLPTGFTVTKAEDATFTITAPSTDDGSATIEITVTKTADSSTGTVTITMTIPKES